MKVEIKMVLNAPKHDTPGSVAMRVMECLDQEFGVDSIESRDVSADHPLLRALVGLIAADNGMVLLDRIDWPPESDMVEAFAQLLDNAKVGERQLYTDGPYENELEIMARGAEHDKVELMLSKGPLGKKQLVLLVRFLNEAFDGDYTANFFAGRKNSVGKLRR